MNITLPEEIIASLTTAAKRAGVTPEALALDFLRERFPAPRDNKLPEPRDEWERGLLSIATDCGVSLPDEAFDREHLYN